MRHGIISFHLQSDANYSPTGRREIIAEIIQNQPASANVPEPTKQPVKSEHQPALKVITDLSVEEALDSIGALKKEHASKRAMRARQGIFGFVATIEENGEPEGLTPLLITAPSVVNSWGKVLQKTTTIAALAPGNLQFAVNTSRRENVVVDSRMRARAGVTVQSLALQAKASRVEGDLLTEEFLSLTSPEPANTIPLYESAVADNGKGKHAPNDYDFHDTYSNYLYGARFFVGWAGLAQAVELTRRHRDRDRRINLLNSWLGQIGFTEIPIEELQKKEIEKKSAGELV